MKRILFTMFMMLSAGIIYGQTTYYWVGGTTPTTSITIGTNWNTALNGSGSSRASSSDPSDILIFDGTNVGGATPATGTVAVLGNGGITCAQIKFINNASATFIRATAGTSTFNLNGGAGEDFVIEAGSSLGLISQTGSLRFAMAGNTTGRVSGSLRMITPLQARFDNTLTGTPGSFRFTSGSSFTTNITSASSSYAFGSNSQSTEKWVVFENGSHLYYEGGYSPVANNSTFTAIVFEPGSTYHHRANNGSGSFLNRRSFGNISVEDGATLTADGPVYRINNLNIDAGCNFITHTSGQTAVMGNITMNGNLTSPAASGNELMLCGAAPQTISGAGTLHPAGIIIANNADVSLAKNIEADNIVNVLGKINFNSSQVTGSSTFNAEGINAAVNATGNTVTGNYIITGNSGISIGMRGYLISGAGIAANTSIISVSTTGDTIYISNALTATATGVAITANSTGAILTTSNANGFDAATGSVIVAGNHSFENNINYIINGATTKPFGISTGSASITTVTGFTDINAAVTANTNLSVSQHVGINGKFTLRPLDTLHILTGAGITGSFGSANYIVTGYNTTTGTQALIKYDGLNEAVIPVGTPNNYLPATLDPIQTNDLNISVFEGITANGLISGTPFTTLQQQTVVNAVWNINRTNGSGPIGLKLAWASPLEGTAFSSLPGSDIGIIENTGTLWSAPLAPGDNINDTARTIVPGSGSYGIGSVAQVDPFVFNNLLPKTYGDADFNGGATSLNTTQPITYTSDNAAVATIIADAIHITGAGTANITASQASDGFYPAASVTKPLTVNKAALNITADAKTKFELLPNPLLTATYSGFVLGETPAVLLTPAVLTTTAVQNSAPGKYPITVSGATAANYTVSFVNDSLTILAKQNQTITFNILTAKNYGNADFMLTASSTNNTIPIVYTSSNVSVATVAGNVVHITGAGTTDITASQAGSDGYFAATNVVRTLTVNKVALTVRVRDTVKIEQTPNPDFTVTYTGFVLGETAGNLTTAPVVTTTAQTNSAPGYYTLTPGGGISQNYNFIYVPGRLTVLPASDTTRRYLYLFVNAAGNLNVRTYSQKPALADVYLYDMGGRLLRKKNLFMPRGFINTEIDLTGIPNGAYAVAIKGNGVDLIKTISIIR
ncbi:MAG: MBG-2 domain-containing protein [Rhizobacter sp.]|nr:MBG-2 domain-containing protein [Ferruginibacter sp.]